MIALSLVVLTLSAQSGWKPIPPVSGNVFTKAGRLELTPTATFSVHDAFYRKNLFGLDASFHLGEAFSIAAYGQYALSSPARAMQICGTDTCAFPSAADLAGRGTGHLVALAGADLRWAPLYGKISVAAE